MLTEKSAGDTSDIISDSSGVGTSNSDTTTCSLQGGGGVMTVVCLQACDPAGPGHLRLVQGDIIEGTFLVQVSKFSMLFRRILQ